MNRYKHIIDLIIEHKPRTICEIGTWNGDRAIQMCSAALNHQEDVYYYGYDLFEAASGETDEKELNVKKHYSAHEVSEKLKAFQVKHKGFYYKLIEGDTNVTLEKSSFDFASFDFAFIDGGHSTKTIYSDWQELNGSKIIVLDDYYSPDENGKCPDVQKHGCNKLVTSYLYDLLPTKDRVKGGGFVQLAYYVSGN